MKILNNKHIIFISLLLLISITNTQAANLTNSKNALTLEGAKKVIATAEAEAKRLSAPGAVIAVVDDGGNLMALERLDNTFPAGATISIGKARTAVLFKRPTKVFEDIIKNGRTAMTALPDSLFTPLQGGIPITVDGQIVGGVGVSGAASAQQDEDIAIAGSKAVTAPDTIPAPSAPVTFFQHDKVANAFEKGMPLLEVDGYKVHASRREKSGQVEVHENETDVLYVLDGSATLITGGKMVEPRWTAPGEVRALRVEGGETQQLAKGDVVVIPQGVPHWFRETSNPFLYFVVKPINH